MRTVPAATGGLLFSLTFPRGPERRKRYQTNCGTGIAASLLRVQSLGIGARYLAGPRSSLPLRYRLHHEKPATIRRNGAVIRQLTLCINVASSFDRLANSPSKCRARAC